MNMRITQDETLEKLKTTQLQGASMKGVHCYDILANPFYVDRFQYVSPATESRAEFIIDDDDEEGNDNA